MHTSKDDNKWLKWKKGKTKPLPATILMYFQLDPRNKLLREIWIWIRIHFSLKSWNQNTLFLQEDVFHSGLNFVRRDSDGQYPMSIQHGLRQLWLTGDAPATSQPRLPECWPDSLHKTWQAARAEPIRNTAKQPTHRTEKHCRWDRTMSHAKSTG